jgi:hypothetical protein
LGTLVMALEVDFWGVATHCGDLVGNK